MTAAKPSLTRIFEETAFLDANSAAYLESLAASYDADATSVGEDWREFFGTLADSRGHAEAERAGPSWASGAAPHDETSDTLAALTGQWPAANGAAPRSAGEALPTPAPAFEPGVTPRMVRDSVRALMFIRNYRVRGHLAADLDPLKLGDRKPHPELQPEAYGFGAADMDREITLDGVLGRQSATMRQIIEIVQRTYCGPIGFEFMHISAPEERAWLQDRIEGPDKDIRFTSEGKRAILAKLVDAESFERFIDKKYTGTKRFGLDGAEAAIPALEQIIKRGGALGIEDIVIGMPHRGRLNVLANVMAKPFRAIFNEFRGGSANPADVEGSGDVKYHLGASSDREFDSNRVHLSLTANPSHLEAVDPVVLGKVRAKQDQKGDKARTAVLPLLLHGDAAFAGQGVVAECFGLSGLKGHRTGGSIHFIVNNQIGFTTAPRFARSSPYPSDVARMIEAPILHVNGDNPEAVTHAAKIAIEFRQKFHKPVVIDMFCYRRFGHNEGDEPAFTQPLMYKVIRQHPSVTEIYARRLEAEGLLAAGEIETMREAAFAHLEREFEASEGYKPNKADWLDGRWAHLVRADDDSARRGDTAVADDLLRRIGGKITALPASFKPHKTIDRLFKARRAMFEPGGTVDWSTAESLAFATLLYEKFPVRLSGQDVERGTFSQRHAVLIDQETERHYTPVNHLGNGQARLEVINSMLSEEAVLGFEYGYSLAEPNALVVWEAQFGDFANGAQVVIDQFLSSGERKWLRMSGLVMLLPHGYEGQGPEHSSARLERYLQLSAEDNWQVANCTTPANYFHILRRQLHRQFRKPLILMTPKSLLRHKRVVSQLAEFGPGSSFHRVLWDPAASPGAGGMPLRPRDSDITRVILCSGKVFYDLYEAREAAGRDDIYIMRVEQLYPFPARALIQELGRFPGADIVWCQEEPKNMGAWSFIEPNIEWVLNHLEAGVRRPRYVGRAASASTAAGLLKKHQMELKAFVEEALAPQEGS